MARDRQSIVKMSRREGYALHQKAHKALAKRSISIIGRVAYKQLLSDTPSYDKSLHYLIGYDYRSKPYYEVFDDLIKEGYENTYIFQVAI